MDISSLNIALVGLGLMGGSLAMALKGSAGTLIGVDHDPNTLGVALSRDLVTSTAHRLEEVTTRVELVILAVPVRRIVSLIRQLPDVQPGGCMVLDLGSTKAEIEQAMELLPSQFTAIGGHPMCGREQSGIHAASGDLYRDQTFILCRNRRTSADMEEIALELVRKIGSRALFMPAESHDRLVAASSHLPYVVSAILMRQAWKLAGQDKRLWQVSASGLKDTTRLAGSDAQMMLEILISNRAHILRQIEGYGQDLMALAEQLRAGDEELLRQTLEAAYQQRSEYLESKYESDGETPN